MDASLVKLEQWAKQRQGSVTGPLISCIVDPKVKPGQVLRVRGALRGASTSAWEVGLQPYIRPSSDHACRSRAMV